MIINFIFSIRPFLDNFAPIPKAQLTCSQESTQECYPSASQEKAFIAEDTDEAAERRWIENVPDYMDKDSYDVVQDRLESELNKPLY